MRRLVVVGVVLAALAAAPAASAGGMGAWALSGPPAGIEAGDVWLAKLRVVSCMGQPAGGVPTLVLLDRTSGQRLTFRGESAGAPGKYVARVVFPSAGNWSYRVNVGGITGETSKTFLVAAAAQKPNRLAAALPPVGAVLLVFGTGLLLRRRRA